MVPVYAGSGARTESLGNAIVAYGQRGGMVTTHYEAVRVPTLCRIERVPSTHLRRGLYPDGREYWTLAT
jgi:hypothetical protein